MNKIIFMVWSIFNINHLTCFREYSDWFQLGSDIFHNSCLDGSVVDVTLAQCRVNNDSQKWRWNSKWQLENKQRAKCLSHNSNGHVMLEECDPLVTKQIFDCFPYVIKIGDRPSYLRATSNVSVVFGNDAVNGNTLWRRFGNTDLSICDTEKTFWQHMPSELNCSLVESGLSPWILAVESVTNEVYFMSTTVSPQKLNISGVVTAAVGATGIWLVEISQELFWVSTVDFPNTVNKIPLSLPDMSVHIADIHVGPMGTVYARSSSDLVCVRLGITDYIPEGDNWSCFDNLTSIMDVTCGVVGCFALTTDGKVHFRTNVTMTNPVGDSWVPLADPAPNKFKYLSAGPYYELWALAVSGLPYRRVGVTVNNPTGSWWEAIPDIRLSYISVGIYGPVGLNSYKGKNIIVTLLDLSSQGRQQEADQHCTAYFKCSSVLMNKNYVNGSRCLMRLNGSWTCTVEDALTEDGQFLTAENAGYAARHVNLDFFKRPVFGNPEIQVRLDRVCSNPGTDYYKADGFYPNIWNYRTKLFSRFLTCGTVDDRLYPSARVYKSFTAEMNRLAKAPCSDVPLGFENGLVPSPAFSANHSLPGRPPHNARLNKVVEWCSNQLDNDLRIDLRFLHKLCAVQLQGVEDLWTMFYNNGNTTNIYHKKLIGNRKYIFPAHLYARSLNFRPFFSSSPAPGKTVCLKMELYGSSLEYLADSCRYYAEKLGATKDGIYNVYPDQASRKVMTYCSFMRNITRIRSYPINDTDLLIYWAFDDSDDIVWKCEACAASDYYGVGAIFPRAGSVATLGDFEGTCISDPDTCLQGFTFEIWLWISNTTSMATTFHQLLRSGSPTSRGFDVHVDDMEVVFIVYTNTSTFRAAATLASFQDEDWLRVLGVWNRTGNFLYIASQAPVTGASTPHPQGLDEISDQLHIGPFAKLNQGFIAFKNLSIWMRPLDEKLEIFERPATDPYKLSRTWSTWSTCGRSGFRDRRRICKDATICYGLLVEKQPCQAPPYFRDCEEVLKSGDTTSGVHELRPDNSSGIFPVYCEHGVADGGWVVVLRRTNGTLDFDRDWTSYAHGFGELAHDFWLGGEKLHNLTKQTTYQILVRFSVGATRLYTRCDIFRVGSASSDYELHIDRCAGDGAHALSYSNTAGFSTSDRDNGGENCAVTSKGGWWYRSCAIVNLYGRVPHVTTPTITYLTENNNVVSFEAVEVFVKKTNYSVLFDVNFKLKFLDVPWNNALNDGSSATFFTLAGKIKYNIRSIYSDNSTFHSVKVHAFSKGSVISDFTIVFYSLSDAEIVKFLDDIEDGFLNNNMRVEYDENDFRILSTAVPKQRPVITNLQNTSSTSLYVRWDAIAADNILHYKVYYKEKVDGSRYNVIMDTISPSSNMLTINGLKKYTIYQVRVLAFNSSGDGIPSFLREVMTDEDVPSKPPGDFKAVWNQSCECVDLSWSEIATDYVHGVLRHYAVVYWPSSDVGSQVAVTATPGQTSLSLTGLDEYESYTVKIAGATRIGEGVWETRVFQTKGELLDAPTNLTFSEITTTSLEVSWNPIQNYSGPAIIGYNVYYTDPTGHVDNVTTSHDQTSVVISGLLMNTVYVVSVKGYNTHMESLKVTKSATTLVGLLTLAPKNLTCPGVTAYTISMRWVAHPLSVLGGSRQGYNLTYHAVGDEDGGNTTITLDAEPARSTIESLKAYTEYDIEMYIFNEAGRGPSSQIRCKTLEGKPTGGPRKIKASSYYSRSEIVVTWEHAPDNEVSGTRKGYKISYSKVAEAGDVILGEKIVKNVVVPADSTRVVLKGLDTYSKYAVEVQVFNSVLTGDTSLPVNGETCRCEPAFYSNWFVHAPYVISHDDGIFPQLIRRMVIEVCGECAEFTGDYVDFVSDGDGNSAQKSGLQQVRQAVTNRTQVSFPVIGPKTGSASETSSFIPVIESPGTVFITRKPSMDVISSYVFTDVLTGNLPIFFITMFAIYFAGNIVWFMESSGHNPLFPTSFVKGVNEGVWWALVSVTTVGYGDRVPMTLFGRVFTMLWVLYGNIMIGFVTSTFTSALIVRVVFKLQEITLYGSQVGAVDMSSEVQLGLLHGAYVNKDCSFPNTSSVLKALQDDDALDGALLDMLVVASITNFRVTYDNLVIKDILENPSCFGILLTGHAAKLHTKFRQYFSNNAAYLTELIQLYTTTSKKTRTAGYTNADAITSEKNLFHPSSPLMRPLLLWVSVFLAIFVVLGLLYSVFLKWVILKRCRVSTVYPEPPPANNNQAENEAAMNSVEEQVCERLKQVKNKHLQEWRRWHALTKSSRKQERVKPRDDCAGVTSKCDQPSLETVC